MPLPDLLPRQLPTTSRWAIHAALFVMVALATVLMILVAGLIDAGPDATPDLTAWLWRWSRPL